MTKLGPRIELAQAQRISRSVLEEIGMFITRGTVVGSVRRKSPTVGDIDLLVEVLAPVDEGIQDIKNTLMAISTWVKGGDRQMTVKDVYGEDVYLDLFLAHPPTNFNALLALRTGPEKESLRLISGLVENGYPHPHAEILVKSPEELMKMAGL